MKKVLPVFAFSLTFLCLCVLITGCDKPKVYRIGVSQCSDDDWRKKMNAEIQRELMFHPEATVEIRSANDNSAKQISDIRYFMDNGFDIIIAAPNEADSITPIISEAYNEGIPVLLFDRNVHGTDYTAWQGADNVAIGRAAGEYIRALVGSDAPVLEIHGLKTSTPAQGRSEGFRSVPLNVVGEGWGEWSYEDSYHVIDSLLTLYPSIRSIFAHNDRMAIAAADVADKHGLSPYIVGVDAAPEIGMKAVKDSILTATFLYPTEGQRLIRTALAILEGEPFDTVKALPAAPAVDASNVGLLLLQNEALDLETERMETLKREVDDYWSQHTSQTTIFYAVLVIVLLLSGLLFMVLRAFWQHRKHQAELDAATASKLAFFTNVSHELRTPLTLIAEPVSQLAEAENLTEQQRRLVKLADKNVHILKRLINQILDFRKHEHGKLKLVLTENDFADLLNQWGEAFDGLARRRDMDFRIDIKADTPIMIAIDAEKMERIFYNLVSNAFKYTPDNGKITVSCEIEDGRNVILSVKDTGEGILADDLPFIFDRFFQGDKVLPEGSGIGLALVKAFVELHDGTIEVKSKKGEGTEFRVTVPIRHVDKVNESPKVLITREIVDAEHSIVEAEKKVATSGEEKPIVLVIDDNADIRTLLTEVLSPEYTVLTAANGAEGLRMAAKYTPDLIICDVMMPVIDGLECCRSIKSEISTSHIPVLMLTACAMDEQRVEGYEVGADGYISKPFKMSVLLTRCHNLIENRKRIKTVWKKEGPIGTIPGKEENADRKEAVNQGGVHGAPDIDNEFYNKFIEKILQQMGNPDLNVDELASSLGLGRSQLYRKIKSLTNYSPVELLRRIRLQKAREMLTTTEKTISEISYEVGFSTPAYFTKCYREAFGETPSELRERLGGNKN